MEEFKEGAQSDGSLSSDSVLSPSKLGALFAQRWRDDDGRTISFPFHC